ncbi:hypothetical protein KP509_05G075800 [Ceratopteris richardii]|uniref:Auxin-responsive protein n=2 Tax=Ceratopteris richardii TaxID=49495 RepID=A0A8T2UQ52_CERRI|nr:hypothetical protein KP509_05G075800 [Ceratopteris richardii]
MTSFIFPATTLSTLSVPSHISDPNYCPRPALPDCWSPSNVDEHEYLSIGIACLKPLPSEERSLELSSNDPSQPLSMRNVATADEFVTSFDGKRAPKRLRDNSSNFSAGVQHDAEDEDNVYLFGSNKSLGPPPSGGNKDVIYNETDNERTLRSNNVGWPPISSYRRETSKSIKRDSSCFNGDVVDTSQFQVLEASSTIKEQKSDDFKYNTIHSISRSHSYSCINSILQFGEDPSFIKVSMHGTRMMRKLDMESIINNEDHLIELQKSSNFGTSEITCLISKTNCHRQTVITSFFHNCCII